MSYMLHGRIRATPGRGPELLAILSEQANAAPMPGCRLYLVATDPEDGDAVWVTEVWDRQSDHDDSLAIPEVREGVTHQLLDAVAGVPGR